MVDKVVVDGANAKMQMELLHLLGGGGGGGDEAESPGTGLVLDIKV